MNHPNVPTPYPAAAELFFRAVMTVDESARALKLAIFLCDVALVAVLLCWLSRLKRSPWWVLAYAWNPLVALEGAGNGHVDLLGALCLVVAAASLARGGARLAAVAFALGVGVKFVPAIFAPLFWRRVRLRDASLCVGILAALYIPFLGHGRLPLGSLGNYLAHWRSNAPVYSALELVFPTAGLIGVPSVSGLGSRSGSVGICPSIHRRPGLGLRQRRCFSHRPFIRGTSFGLPLFCSLHARCRLRSGP